MSRWRDAVDPAGDFCEWFSVRDDVLVDLLAGRDPSVRDCPQPPFGMPPSELRRRVSSRLLASLAI